MSFAYTDNGCGPQARACPLTVAPEVVSGVGSAPRATWYESSRGLQEVIRTRPMLKGDRKR